MLGTARFGSLYGVATSRDLLSKRDVGQILGLASAKGIHMIDTAPVYGTSESLIGAVKPPGFKIVTKIPPVPAHLGEIRSWLFQSVESSLEELKVSSVYGFLLHQPTDLLGSQGKAIATALKDVRLSGKCEKIGISIYDPKILPSVFDVMSFDLVQAPLNIVDRRLETSGWLQKLKALDVEVHVRSVFLQGLLLLPERQMPIKFARWSQLWRNWYRFLECSPDEAIQVCLSYPLRLAEVDRIVVGVESYEQLSKIINVEKQGPCNSDVAFMMSDDETLINPSEWAHL